MSKKRVKFEGGYIVIRSGTVQDDVDGQLIASKLLNASGPDDAGLYKQFGQLCAQTEKAEGLPFRPELMRPQTSAFELQGAYAAFARMPLSIRDKWTTAQNQLNRDDAVTIEDWDENPDPKSQAAQTGNESIGNTG